MLSCGPYLEREIAFSPFQAESAVPQEHRITVSHRHCLAQRRGPTICKPRLSLPRRQDRWNRICRWHIGQRRDPAPRPYDTSVRLQCSSERRLGPSRTANLDCTERKGPPVLPPCEASSRPCRSPAARRCPDSKVRRGDIARPHRLFRQTVCTNGMRTRCFVLDQFCVPDARSWNAILTAIWTMAPLSGVSVLYSALYIKRLTTKLSGSSRIVITSDALVRHRIVICRPAPNLARPYCLSSRRSCRSC